MYVGSWDDNVYSLNASTSSQLWNFTTRRWVESSPAVVDGVVYVGSDDGNLYALDASTGTKLCSFTVGAYVYSYPAVVGDVDYVGSTLDYIFALETPASTSSVKPSTSVVYSPNPISAQLACHLHDLRVRIQPDWRRRLQQEQHYRQLQSHARVEHPRSDG